MLIAFLLIILLHIQLLVDPTEIITNESRLVRPHEIQFFASPSDRGGLASSTETGALKVPSKIFHPSVSLDSVSPNLFMQLVGGTSTRGIGGDNGAATSAQFSANFPWVDISGNIYIPDYGAFRIRKIDNSGIVTNFGGTGEQSTNGTGSPKSIIVEL
jgi:hypothetical protein